MLLRYLLAALLMISFASGSQVTPVDPSHNLSLVLAHASPGDTLLLADGVYQPGVTLIINKNITIAAQTLGGAVIDGQGQHAVIELYSPRSPGGKAYLGTVALKGLNITGGLRMNGGGINVFIADDLHIDHCNIYGNQAENGGAGIYISSTWGSTHVTISNTNIFSNHGFTHGRYGGGMVVENGAIVDVSNTNIFSNVGAFGGGGVYIQSGTFNCESCNIYNNTALWAGGGGVLVDANAYKPKVKLDDKSSVHNNHPDNCIGWLPLEKLPACNK